jgi:hypothetical protein
MSARDQAVLAAIARRTAKIGFMLFEMRRAADSIGTILMPDVDPADAAREFAGLGDLDAPASVAVNGAAPQQGVAEPEPDLPGPAPDPEPDPVADEPRNDMEGAGLFGDGPAGHDPAHGAGRSGADLAGHDDAPPAPSPWAVPAPPPGTGGWHEEEPSPLFSSHEPDEPHQSASDAAWRN